MSFFFPNKLSNFLLICSIFSSKFLQPIEKFMKFLSNLFIHVLKYLLSFFIVFRSNKLIPFESKLNCKDVNLDIKTLLFLLYSVKFLSI